MIGRESIKNFFEEWESDLFNDIVDLLGSIEDFLGFIVI